MQLSFLELKLTKEAKRKAEKLNGKTIEDGGEQHENSISRI